MNNDKKNTFKRITLTILILTCGAMNGFPRWMNNKSEIAFSATSDKINATEFFIVQGATSFLDAYANIMEYLKITEAITVDGENAREIMVLLEKAALSMRQANQHYRDLYAAAVISPLDPIIITALGKFDYAQFALTQRQYINQEIFNEVKAYLSIGDILGLYSRIVERTEQMSEQLTQLILASNEGKTVSLTETWKINQMLASHLLFGQYPAQIFHSLSKSKIQFEKK